jgi:hypothetical protein
MAVLVVYAYQLGVAWPKATSCIYICARIGDKPIMKEKLRCASRFIAILFIPLFSVLILLALQAQRSLITKPIDETARVALRGNLNPLIKTASDTGVVSDGTSTGTHGTITGSTVVTVVVD